MTSDPEISFIGPTCNELAPGSVPQIASGVAGIARSIADSDTGNTAIIAAGLPGCCRALTAADADTRISLGVAIATKARNLAETDLQSAQQVESLVCSTCADVVLSRSYVLARGDDSLGTLIADIDTFDCSRAPDIPFNRTPGGGLASNN